MQIYVFFVIQQYMKNEKGKRSFLEIDSYFFVIQVVEGYYPVKNLLKKSLTT